MPEREDGERSCLGRWLAHVWTGGRYIGPVRASDAPYRKERRAGAKPSEYARRGTDQMACLELWYDMAKHMLWFGETLDSRIDQHRTSGLRFDRMR